MKFIRVLTAAALFAALFVLAFPVHADCGDGDPNCLLEPPVSREIRIASTRGEAAVTAAESDAITPLDFAVPMPLPRRVEAPLVSAQSEPNSTDSIPDFANLSITMRYQTAGDVSCGVQALGMALDGFDGSAPTSNSILGFLQDQGMMYDFGTGVEELAHAAQNFGYAGSLPFHGWSLDQLMATLAEGKPAVVALGANGEGAPGHFVTVTGVSADGKWVSYNDPTLGHQVISAEEFERLWGLQGNSGVVVAEAVPAGAPVNFAPWVALFATLMALISTTPYASLRKGIGGMLTASSSGSTSSAPPYPAPAGKRLKKNIVTKYKTIWEQEGWDYENKTVPKYENQRVQVGTTTIYDKIPRHKTVRVQKGWDLVEKVVPKMVRKKVQVGTTTVYDKIPLYRTVRVQDGWDYIPERVPAYKNQRYVKYYRTSRQRKKRYRYYRGRRRFAGYYYVTKRTPVYGTRRVRSGWTTGTKRVPHYVNKREFAGYDVKTTEVPNYEWRMVQDGFTVTHKRVPHMVDKRVLDGFDFIPKEVPKYEWKEVQVGWKTEKERVPHMVQKQVPDRTQVEWELERVITIADTGGPELGFVVPVSSVKPIRPSCIPTSLWYYLTLEDRWAIAESNPDPQVVTKNHTSLATTNRPVSIPPSLWYHLPAEDQQAIIDAEISNKIVLPPPEPSFLANSECPPGIDIDLWRHLTADDHHLILEEERQSLDAWWDWVVKTGNNENASLEDWLALREDHKALDPLWKLIKDGEEKVWATPSSLTVRDTPQGGAMGYLVYSQTVNWTGKVKADKEGDYWYQINYTDAYGRKKVGWVSSSYMERYVAVDPQHDPSQDGSMPPSELWGNNIRLPQDSLIAIGEADQYWPQYISFYNREFRTLLEPYGETPRPVNFNLCGFFDIAASLGIDLLEMLRTGLQDPTIGPELAQIVANDETTTRGQLQPLLDLYGRGYENSNGWISPIDFAQQTQSGRTYIALTGVDSSLEGTRVTSGHLVPDGSGHWVLVTDVLPAGNSGWVRLYNSLSHRMEVLSFDEFNATWGRPARDNNSRHLGFWINP